MRTSSYPLILQIRLWVLPLLLFMAVGFSFWQYPGWLRLCAGLAMFLFGMQLLEEGLRQLAGSKLEKVLQRSTSSHFRGFLFGVGGTAVLQSTTLMSLLTIAFISAGLIQLSGGISILLGINVGTSFGIWLLALAGQDFSVKTLAYPLLSFGMLAVFSLPKGTAIGKICLGIALIFFGIDGVKAGFSSFGDLFDFSKYNDPGITTQLIFVGIGLVLTAILQSSHATLILVFAALSSGQIQLAQGMAIAIGSNLGSSVTTAIVGWLGGNRSGQRLAIMHVIFNLSCALLSLALFIPLYLLSVWSVELIGFGNNALLELAMFAFFFNLLGVIVFWPWQKQLEKLLLLILPDKVETESLVTANIDSDNMLTSQDRTDAKTIRFLDQTALASFDTAATAVVKELYRLGRISLGVICHAIYQPVTQLYADELDEQALIQAPNTGSLNADELYKSHIKGIYAEILSFISLVDFNEENEEKAQQQREFWVNCQVVTLQLVEAVKDAKHLQKNLKHYLMENNSLAQQHYFELRRYLMLLLRQIYSIEAANLSSENAKASWQKFETEVEQFKLDLQQRLFNEIRTGLLNGFQASSLMNDLVYLDRILQSFSNIIHLRDNLYATVGSIAATTSYKAGIKPEHISENEPL